MAGTATVTFFHQSGFTVAVEDTLLVFDYWRGENAELPESARLQESDFDGYRQILVFVTSRYEDHFDEVIYTWDRKKYPITYILSDDLESRWDGLRMKPGDQLTVGGTEICAFDSTDAGVSFYVTAHGIHIFHAGDLNLWHWKEESTLRQIRQAEERFYAALTPLSHLPMDIAMFPLDPRQGGMYEAGANHFLMTNKPRVFIPMHWHNRPEVATGYARSWHVRYTAVVALTRPRERAEFSFTEKELSIHIFTRRNMPREGGKAEVELNAYSPSDPFSDTDLPVKF